MIMSARCRGRCGGGSAAPSAGPAGPRGWRRDIHRTACRPRPTMLIWMLRRWWPRRDRHTMMVAGRCRQSSTRVRGRHSKRGLGRGTGCDATRRSPIRACHTIRLSRRKSDELDKECLCVRRRHLHVDDVLAEGIQHLFRVDVHILLEVIYSDGQRIYPCTRSSSTHPCA